MRKPRRPTQGENVPQLLSGCPEEDVGLQERWGELGVPLDGHLPQLLWKAHLSIWRQL